MCFPRVIDRPMPKKITPKRHVFIRSARSCNCSSVSPVSATSSLFTGWLLIRARSVVRTSKSFPGLI